MPVFITGASSGLGAALARHYAAQGQTLGLLARRADRLQSLMESLPGQHQMYVADVCDRDALHAAARDFQRCVGFVDTVIACAGISAGTLTECEDDFSVFNAIMQRDIESDARPLGTSPRRALPMASNDLDAKKIAAELMNQFGFDAIDAGTLEESWRFERAMPCYCIALVAEELTTALASAQRGVELPHGSWQTSRRFIQAYG